MKRIIALLLLLCMLCACQPTPDHEFVVNKGDDMVEQKLNATLRPAAEPTAAPTEAPQEEIVSETKTAEPTLAAPTAAPLLKQTFPERWEEAEERVSEHLSISVNAEILQREDGLYPVYRTRGTEMTKERAGEIAAAILPKPVDVFTQERTKEDYKRELQSYLDWVAEMQAWVEAGMPPWPDHDTRVPTQEEIDAETARLQQAILNAPDTLERRTVSDYGDLRLNGTSAFTLENGEIASVVFRKGLIAVSKGCSQMGYLYYQYYYEEDKRLGEPQAKIWKDVTTDRTAAEETLRAEMERLGFSDFAIESAYPANLFDSTGDKLVYVTGGWAFRLIRDYGGYPSVSVPYQPSQFLNYGTGSDTVVNEPINKEQINVLINEDGIRYFAYSAPKEVVELTNESVELLPFETVKERAKNALKTCFPSAWAGDADYSLEIYRMLLTTYTLHIKDSDEYYEMPCWVVFFDGNTYTGDRERLRGDENTGHDALFLNAVDGSIIHPDWGY